MLIREQGMLFSKEEAFFFSNTFYLQTKVLQLLFRFPF